MVRNQDPIALPPHATVEEACRRMRHHCVGAVLVTEGDRQLRGIFTGRDAVHRVLAEGRSVDTTLAEVMTRDPDCITPGKKAIEALRLMEDGRYRHLPIVEDGKYIVDARVAKELLPTQEGFFFGSTDYDEYYYSDLQDTKQILEEALKDAHADFEYCASW